ncbi:MAG: hypothetical protein V3W28_09210 [Thermoplasmata archaeon]
MLTLLVFDREARKVLVLKEFKDEKEAFRRHMESAEKHDGNDAVTVELFTGGKKQLLDDFPWYAS